MLIFFYCPKKDDTKGGYICRDCWVRVDAFNVFCLHIQSIHQSFYSGDLNAASQDWKSPDDCKVNATLSIKTEVQPDVFVAPIDEVHIPISPFQAIQTNDISTIQETSKSNKQPTSKSPVKKLAKKPTKKTVKKTVESPRKKKEDDIQ